MQVTLEILKTHAPDGIKVAIPGLLQSTLWTLEGVLTLLQLPTFEELVKAWEIAGDNADTAREYQRLAQSVQAEVYISENNLRLILEWYYQQFIANSVIPKQ